EEGTTAAPRPPHKNAPPSPTHRALGSIAVRTPATPSSIQARVRLTAFRGSGSVAPRLRVARTSPVNLSSVALRPRFSPRTWTRGSRRWVPRLAPRPARLPALIARVFATNPPGCQSCSRSARGPDLAWSGTRTCRPREGEASTRAGEHPVELHFAFHG